MYWVKCLCRHLLNLHREQDVTQGQFLAEYKLHKNAASNLEQVLAATPLTTPTVRPPAS